MRPGVTDDHRRPEILLVATPPLADVGAHADGAPPFVEDDLGDLVVDPARSATPFDHLARGRRDGLRPADREPRPVAVVVDHHGVLPEGAARRRETVVAPLRGEQRAQPGVADPPAHLVGRGAKGDPPVAGVGERHPPAQRASGRPRPRLAPRPRGRSPGVAEVRVDAVRLVREELDEPLPVGGGVGGDAEVQVRVVEDVVVVRHRLPVDLPARHHVHERAGGRPRAHPPDVVQAYVPPVALALELVREAAEREVPLEDEHALAGQRRQGRRGRQPADVRADDDDVVVLHRSTLAGIAGRVSPSRGPARRRPRPARSRPAPPVSRPTAGTRATCRGRRRPRRAHPARAARRRAGGPHRGGDRSTP